MLHVVGQSSSDHPFKGPWAKDVLAAKMFGSYVIIFIRCPFVSSSLMVVACPIVLGQLIWGLLNTAERRFTFTEETALFVCPTTAVVEWSFPILEFCQAEPVAGFVLQPFVGVASIIMYVYKFFQ